MKRLLLGILAFTMLLFVSCDSGDSGNDNKGGGTQTMTYMQITPKEAKEAMDAVPDCVILDVRTQEEYAQGHIPDAMLIPVDELKGRAQAELSNKGQLILVYCRSGNRSKTAAQILVDLGYGNVKEFGGIEQWPYEIVTE